MIYDFIDEFNAEFGTQIKEKEEEKPMLKRLFYDYLQQEFKSSDLYRSIADKIVVIEEELKASLTADQEKLLDKFELYKDELSSYTSLQSFMYGFCLDKELCIEKDNSNRGAK